MTYLIYDVAILALLALFVLLGVHRGFILTLCGLLAVFVAFWGASFLSDLLCAPVGRLLQPVLEQSITQVLQEKTDSGRWLLQLPSPDPDGSREEDGEGQAASLPLLPLDQALSALEDTRIYKTFGPALEDALRDGILTLTASAAASIAAYVATEVARVVLFLISFAVVLLAWALLSHALDLAFRLPVLSTVNRVLGGAAGLVKGALLVFIAAWLLKGSLFPQSVIDHTLLLKFFCENSPLSLISAL